MLCGDDKSVHKKEDKNVLGYMTVIEDFISFEVKRKWNKNIYDKESYARFMLNVFSWEIALIDQLINWLSGALIYAHDNRHSYRKVH